VFGERGGHLREGDHDLRAKVRWGAKRLTPWTPYTPIQFV
jgi:hypothetical protein